MKSWVRLASMAMAVACMSAASAWAGPPAAAPDSPVVMKPGQGLPMDAGGKKFVSYFQRQDGACGLTVVLSESQNGGLAAGGQEGPQGTRISVEVRPGKTLKIDGGLNRTAEFFCGPSGRKMNARLYTRESYKSAKVTK